LTSEFKPGDRVIVINANYAKEWFKEGLTGTVTKTSQDRVFVILDGEHTIRGEMNGNKRRFRLLTPLDEVVK
jgi:ribosomal protein L21E